MSIKYPLIILDSAVTGKELEIGQRRQAFSLQQQALVVVADARGTSWTAPAVPGAYPEMPRGRRRWRRRHPAATRGRPARGCVHLLLRQLMLILKMYSKSSDGMWCRREQVRETTIQGGGTVPRGRSVIAGNTRCSYIWSKDNFVFPWRATFVIN